MTAKALFANDASISFRGNMGLTTLETQTENDAAASSSITCGIEEYEVGEVAEQSRLSLLFELNWKLWRVAIPAISSQLVIVMVETLSMIFVGRLDDINAIAGVGLAIIFVNGTTTSVLLGLNGAVAVLVAVSFGRGDIEDCEIILQRGRILSFFASLPLTVLQICCYPILLAFGI